MQRTTKSVAVKSLCRKVGLELVKCVCACTAEALINMSSDKVPYNTHMKARLISHHIINVQCARLIKDHK